MSVNYFVEVTVQGEQYAIEPTFKSRLEAANYRVHVRQELSEVYNSDSQPAKLVVCQTCSLEDMIDEVADEYEATDSDPRREQQ